MVRGPTLAWLRWAGEDEEDLTGAGKFKKPRLGGAGKFHRLAAYSGMAATRLYVVFIRGLKSR
jgi:hypothetical protein